MHCPVFLLKITCYMIIFKGIKTWHNSKFQTISVLNCLDGKNEENEITNAEEIRKHGKSLLRVFKYKWERKHALFQNILKLCIFLPKPSNILLFFGKIVHMPLLSRICPGRPGN